MKNSDPYLLNTPHSMTEQISYASDLQNCSKKDFIIQSIDRNLKYFHSQEKSQYEQTQKMRHDEEAPLDFFSTNYS
jgi:hypothetical protein